MHIMCNLQSLWGWTSALWLSMMLGVISSCCEWQPYELNQVSQHLFQILTNSLLYCHFSLLLWLSCWNTKKYPEHLNWLKLQISHDNFCYFSFCQRVISWLGSDCIVTSRNEKWFPWNHVWDSLMSKFMFFPRKEILQEYFDLSSLLQDEVVCVHKEMTKALKAIEPNREYESFIQQNR